MLSRVTPTTPTVCPVSLETLRRHAYIAQTQSDDLLAMYGIAATELAEQATNRYFLQRTVQWTLSTDSRTPTYYTFAAMLQNYFNTYQHPWLHLPHSSSAIASMVIGKWGVSDTTLVINTDYEIDLHTDPARIRLLSFAEFDPEVDHLTVQYTTGYTTDPLLVPQSIRTAICLMTASMFEHRGDAASELWSPAADALLTPYKTLHFAGSSALYGA